MDESIARGDENLVFPIYDEKSSEVHGFRPWTNWILIGCNVFVFLYLQMLPKSAVVSLAFQFGLVPASILHTLEGGDIFQAGPLNLLSHMFLHVAWWHLWGNMLFLWVFGDDVEKATGHLRFLLLYVLSGIAGAIAHAFSDPVSTDPLFGASAAIAGVVGSYVLLRPNAKIIALLGIVPVRMRAIWLVSIWVAFQVIGIFVPQTQIKISYWGHLGGFVTGAVAFMLLRRPEVPLFAFWRKNASRKTIMQLLEIGSRESAIKTIHRASTFFIWFSIILIGVTSVQFFGSWLQWWQSEAHDGLAKLVGSLIGYMLGRVFYNDWIYLLFLANGIVLRRYNSRVAAAIFVLGGILGAGLGVFMILKSSDFFVGVCLTILFVVYGLIASRALVAAIKLNSMYSDNLAVAPDRQG